MSANALFDPGWGRTHFEFNFTINLSSRWDENQNPLLIMLFKKNLKTNFLKEICQNTDFP
jgi:hypothetical protein